MLATDVTIEGKGCRIGVLAGPGTVETHTHCALRGKVTIPASIGDSNLFTRLAHYAIPEARDFLVTRESKGQCPAIDRRTNVGDGDICREAPWPLIGDHVVHLTITTRRCYRWCHGATSLHCDSDRSGYSIIPRIAIVGLGSQRVDTGLLRGPGDGIGSGGHRADQRRSSSSRGAVEVDFCDTEAVTGIRAVVE